MKKMLVRYRTKPDQADTNQSLIEAVFEDLRRRKPDGVRYLVLRLADGMFVHFAAIEGETNPLTALDTFRAFQSDIDRRCLETPRPSEATIVGDYRMLGE